MEEAGRLMDTGDSVPPMLYNNSVLRKAKEEEFNKRLNLENTDPFVNLHLAKYSSLMGIIHSIVLDPFYTFYWTKEQALMYKLAHKSLDGFMTIDTTGGISKKIRLPNEQQSIFLYRCMYINNNGNFPVFQMVSAKQDASLISYFLSESGQ